MVFCDVPERSHRNFIDTDMQSQQLPCKSYGTSQPPAWQLVQPAAMMAACSVTYVCHAHVLVLLVFLLGAAAFHMILRIVTVHAKLCTCNLSWDEWLLCCSFSRGGCQSFN
jgi:hypothetical protein